MKNLSFFLIILFLPVAAMAQTAILRGRVLDERGQGLPGANVFLRGTYDGANTDSTGAFRFSSSRKDTATLAVSFVGYEPFNRKITLPLSTEIIVKLREEANTLNTVVITAGSFEASDEKRMTMLKATDIVTTAGVGADIAAAVNLMPGAQRVGEQEGIFVRGGSAQESKVVIDGLIVQNPFFSSLPDVQQRGRFQPFMFKGTAFSTGGYSAQYGQALSGLLLLNTTDKGNNNGLSLSLNLASTGLTYDQANEKSSFSGTAYYSNLKPLFALVKQRVTWTREPEYAGTSLTYRLKPTKNGLLKVYGMFNDSRVGMVFRDPSAARPGNELGNSELQQHNRNLFLTSTYTDSWDEGRWLLNTGASYSHDTDQTTVGAGQDIGRFSERIQARAVLTRLLAGNNSILFGGEANVVNLGNRVNGTPYSISDHYGAVFVESETYLGRKLALRPGIRAEYSSIIGRFNVAPRLSAAYKTGPYSQVSVAYGQFYQTSDYPYLFRNTNLGFERADHLILNVQHIKNQRTFRIEMFYKNYNQLVREFTGANGAIGPFDANPYRFPWGQTNNTGNGYAQGFDVFWRDQKTIKGFDYWVTYSYVDTKRLFQQYAVSAQPTFVSNHNASLILKRYFEKISTNIGLTYAFTSGRPYYNPNRVGQDGTETPSQFLADRTPAVHNVSISASHVMTIKKNFVILYATADNLLNTPNVFAYRYTPDKQTRYAVGPTTYRSFFVGGIIMLNQKAKVNATDL
jgi:outer membrane cobalamin receptor